jgi:hypothetical protein
MTSVDEIEKAVADLGADDLAAFRDWFEAFAAERLGHGAVRNDGGGPVAPKVRRLSSRERARLMADAQDHSRRLKGDPADGALLDELEALQVDNADVLR